MRVSGYLYILEQFAAALSLLIAAGLAAGAVRCVPSRLILTALADALASAAEALMPHSALRLSLLAVVLLSPVAAWPGLPRALRFRLPLIALILTLTLSGSIRFLHTLPLPGCLCVLIACWLPPALARRTRRAGTPQCVSVELRCRECRVMLTALVDTGNLLHDPISGLPVIVVSHRAAAHLVPLPAPGELSPGMRMISVRTVSGSSLMTIFRPDSVRLMHQGSWQTVRAMVGISPDGYDGVQALVPAGLLHAAPTSAILSQGG